MDDVRRKGLIERIGQLGLPLPDRPLPLVTLEEFFVGNDDYGSIGCNLNPMLGPQFFFEKLRLIRRQPNVQDVLVEVVEVEEEDESMWPFSDRVYVFADAAPDAVGQWAAALHPDAVEEGFAAGQPDSAPELRPGFKCYSLWWD